MSNDDFYNKMIQISVQWLETMNHEQTAILLRELANSLSPCAVCEELSAMGIVHGDPDRKALGHEGFKLMRERLSPRRVASSTRSTLAKDEPEDASPRSQSIRPRDTLPMWMVFFTEEIMDGVSPGRWESVLARYAVIKTKMEVMDDDAWRRCDYITRLEAVTIARESTDDEKAKTACSKVMELCAREAKGLRVSTQEWTAARGLSAHVALRVGSTEAAAWIAAWDAEDDSRSRRDSASAARDASCSAADAARNAARILHWKNGLPGGKLTAAVMREARDATWDRISDAAIGAIEIECGIVQRRSTEN